MIAELDGEGCGSIRHLTNRPLAIISAASREPIMPDGTREARHAMGSIYFASPPAETPRYASSRDRLR